MLKPEIQFKLFVYGKINMVLNEWFLSSRTIRNICIQFILGNPCDEVILAPKGLIPIYWKITIFKFMVQVYKKHSWLQHIFHAKHFQERFNIYSSKYPKYKLKTTRWNLLNHSALFTGQWGRSCWPEHKGIISQLLYWNMKPTFDMNYEYWILKAHFTSLHIHIGWRTCSFGGSVSQIHF